MHFLLKDGEGLAIINTLFCRDGSKALPEKKIYCELPETAWLCVREESELFLSSEELQGAGFGPGGGLDWENSRNRKKRKKLKTPLICDLEI